MQLSFFPPTAYPSASSSRSHLVVGKRKEGQKEGRKEGREGGRDGGRGNYLFLYSL